MTESAGVLLYRRGPGGIEVLVAHPGGPFWAAKDEGAWSIPKGEIGPGEDPAAAAIREFEEETGLPLPEGVLLDLGTITQRGGKVVRAFAVEGDLDPVTLRSNVIEVEWPPRTGRRIPVPEIDRVAWMAPAAAVVKLNPAQAALVDRLLSVLGRSSPSRGVDHAE